jgi:predicted nucleotide-binding protein
MNKDKWKKPMANFGVRAVALLAELNNLREGLKMDIGRVHDDAERLLKAARKIGESWSGSNLGYHGELFFGDFKKPPLGERFSVEWGGLNGIPSGWKARTPEEVKLQIEELAGVRTERLESTSKHLVDNVKQFQDKLLIELAPLHNIDGFIKEKELLDELEHFDWGEKAMREYAMNALNSFPNVTRDRQAIMQGRMIPAHTYYEAIAAQSEAHTEAIQRFWRLADRLLKQIELQKTEIPVSVDASAKKSEEQYVNGECQKTVFLIHGRAEAAQQKVARFLEKLDLNVIILSEQPSKGRTIIEKFEQHSDVGFAVALLTPDDVGGLADEPAKLRLRARQNVVLEFGYFIGKLGRSKVCALYVEGVELPSDLHGVGYVSFDPAGAWKLKLATEMKAVGMGVDLNKAVP